MVASPLQKQRYSLKTGNCLDVEGVVIATYEAKIENNQVFVNF